VELEDLRICMSLRSTDGDPSDLRLMWIQLLCGDVDIELGTFTKLD
jgi:hypothetical protein